MPPENFAYVYSTKFTTYFALYQSEKAVCFSFTCKSTHSCDKNVQCLKKTGLFGSLCNKLALFKTS